MTRHCAIADDSGVTDPADFLFIGHAYLLDVLYIKTVYRLVHSPTSIERLTAIGPRSIAGTPITGPLTENSAATKKTAEKALIPLPPAGYEPLFFEKRLVAKIELTPGAVVESRNKFQFHRLQKIAKARSHCCTVRRQIMRRMILLDAHFAGARNRKEVFRGFFNKRWLESVAFFRGRRGSANQRAVPTHRAY
jgi:hypothetical protein